MSVLAVLIILTALAVAFLVSSRTNLQVSASGANAVQARLLGDSAVGMVELMLRKATQDPRLLWTSQPGLLRTFDTSGKQTAVYRLYSDNELISPTYNLQGADAVPADWAAQSGVYVDLNAPVAGQYPIADASALNAVAGFTVKNAPATSSNPLPMPVRWLYALSDGSLVAPSSSGGKLKVAGATDKNPIVGRIAYWADDETCKVNVNTAAGDAWNAAAGDFGGFWDTPRSGGKGERSLANFQPARNEFQRYPGHPATTYLSAVFPDLTAAQILGLAPRYDEGGSKSGTQVATGPLPITNQRLLASSDELVFTPDRNLTALNQDVLARARFFLTATSRAPELNPFALPKLSMWPVNASTAPGYRTVFDRLIAFCSTINGHPFYFQRSNSGSATNDIQNIPRNAELLAYLKTLTGKAIPGFGGDFLSKYSADRDQILTEMVDYIRSTNLFDDLLEQETTGSYNYPTSGHQFTSRRLSNREVDFGHGQVVPLRTSNDTMGFGRFFTVSEIAMHFICTADAANAPSNIATDPDSSKVNRTLGGIALQPGQKRVEAALLLELFCPAQGWTAIRGDAQIKVTFENAMTLSGQPLAFPSSGVRRFKAGPKLSNGNTVTTYNGRYWGGFTGIRMVLTGGKIPARGVMPADTGLTSENVYPFVSAPVTIPNAGTMAFSGGKLKIEIFPAGADTNTDPPVQTIRAEFPGAPTLPQPTLVDNAAAGTRENWWTFSSDGAVGNKKGRISIVSNSPGSNEPGKAENPALGAWIRSNDVVISLVPGHGDIRLVAASPEVDRSVFVPLPGYGTNAFSHTLDDSVSTRYLYGYDASGKLVPGANYSSYSQPDFPNLAAAQAAWTTGDWDNGTATVADGPYIGKPDEGNQYRASPSSVPYFDDNEEQEAGGPTFFSPNRLIASPVNFGSLPTGVKAGVPWRTLLFRPDSAHPGAASPADSLLLDFFWMPVVEPYVISEPFSTAGKVNMNYAIAPFSYIKRNTALRAVLRSEQILAIPTSKASSYKSSTSQDSFRRILDVAEQAGADSVSEKTGTLRQFEDRFANGEVFRSPSEICSLYLVPQGTQLTQMKSFWSTNALTGDNSREASYGRIYPRLTTQSNVFTVHYKAQILARPSKGTPVDEWVEDPNKVLAEYQGATTIERYIDAANTTIADPATAFSVQDTGLAPYYLFRRVQHRRFNP
ncbi:Verru_Chthon cassette protein A [Terrimicrobium sacchariphilum]|uniref:Verru_Chthon cassette protein A n=1 Tax=Terrimicrobium sacchariphilum TaxID=690879 RepID=UPI0014718765|nr:Verru_Chthon cassette protein A [Terrimicrobium sacchariphilum]